MQFRSIQSRFILLVLLFLLPTLSAIYWFVSREILKYTDQTIGSYLDIGVRNAFGAADAETILDAVLNLLDRSNGAAALMLIADMQAQVIVDTGSQGFESPPHARRTVIEYSYRENEENLAVSRQRILDFSIAVICISLTAFILLARSYSRPAMRIADRVVRIQDGDYEAGRSVPVVTSSDELGKLAEPVENMASGLVEKEKAGDLLGKVVSNRNADELLRKKPELGGEERDVSILFADTTGFTSLSANWPPAQVLTILNTCLEQICRIIEKNNGVVDKFTDVGVMAIFGAPVADQDDCHNAVRTAAVEGFVWREVVWVQVKGRQSAVTLYGLLGRRQEVSETAMRRVDIFHEALRLYRSGQWDVALETFQRLKSEGGESTIDVFMVRIGYLNGLSPADWDGVYAHRDALLMGKR
jgi:class 3 adenylate cyclase